jgi:N-acetylmuramic acid 6-phosphate etherase
VTGADANSKAAILAVDLGKTGCRVALWRDGVRTEAEGVGTPGLAGPGGAAMAEAAILAVAAPLLRAAGAAEVDAVGVGAAGALAAPAAAGELAERLCRSLPARRVAVASDATTSHAGALGGGPGIVLAAGTGAVALAVGPDGATHRVDGCGPWLGDEGGGAWLGLHGLRAALRAADGRGPSTSLTNAAIARFGPLADLVARMEGHESPPRLAASFAADVAEAARADDAVAATLVFRAAGLMADAVRAASSRLPDGEPRRLAMIGGLLAIGPVLTDPMRASLREAVPKLVHVAAEGTSLDGARLLAMRADTVHERGVIRAVSSGAAADRLDLLATEGLRPGLDDLDLRSPGAVARLVLESERVAQNALSRASDQLAAAAEAVAARMRQGGRLFYLGAGTPGRLAVLDAAELAPTYSAPPGLVIAILAGGPSAMIEAVEGAEDDADAAALALESHGLVPIDAVVGIAASGRTPFVVGGLRHARGAGALAIAIVNNAASPAAASADLAVEILTGAELIAGSTRMTAGTTQKIALNALSTAAMVALGKTYGARMVDVRASNEKLRRRALRMVRDITGAAEPEAAAALAAAGGRVKPAVVALLAGVDAAAADRLLADASGRVRDAIAAAANPL